MKTKPKTKKVPFSKLPAWKKRVVIAKDVIARIKAEQYRVQYGSYCSIEQTECELQPTDDIKENLGKIKKCKVCALGGLLMSATSFVNNVIVNDVKYYVDFKINPRIKKVFESLFTAKQLSLIEYAFEGSIAESYSNYGAEVLGAKREENFIVKQFHLKYANDAERLTAICKNIIKNKGTFKP